jgi:hypothetical protein
MPIPRELRHLYTGPEWQSIRARILKREQDRCKFCLRPNGSPIRTKTGKGRMYWRRFGSLTWHNEMGWPLTTEEYEQAMELGARTITVRLGVAHLNHDPRDNSDENLAALCGWCHLMHDRGKHKQTRSVHKDQRRPLLQMEATA